MKGQCDKHGCSELLCGCPADCLITSSAYWEQLRAKDKWIERLLKQNQKLKECVEFISDPPDYNCDFYKMRDRARQCLAELGKN